MCLPCSLPLGGGNIYDALEEQWEEVPAKKKNRRRGGGSKGKGRKKGAAQAGG